jgi:ATP-dependent Clp protease protease subunit
MKTRKQLSEIIAATSGQPLDKVERDVDRDYYMTAEEAKAYGIVDSVVRKL